MCVAVSKKNRLALEDEAVSNFQDLLARRELCIGIRICHRDRDLRAEGWPVMSLHGDLQLSNSILVPNSILDFLQSFLCCALFAAKCCFPEVKLSCLAFVGN